MIFKIFLIQDINLLIVKFQLKFILLFLMNESSVQKQLMFWNRARQQYDKANKPMVYQLDFNATNKPRSAKFLVFIKKFIEVYKKGMKQVYDNEQDNRQNYWSELTKKFQNQYEMSFVNDRYWQKPKNKILKYFALLVHTKRIFQVLSTIFNDLSHLYVQKQKKINQANKELENLDFLKSGQYKILGQIITKFDEYAEQKAAQQKIKQIERQRLRKQKEEQQRKKRQQQQQEKLKKQEQQRRKKEEEQKRRQIQKKLEQSKKVNTQQTPIITSDYFPQQYKAQRRSQKPVMKQSPSKQLVLPSQFNKSTKKLKNSQKLYRERYEDQLSVFSYNLKPEQSKQQNECTSCQTQLKGGLYLVGNKNYCNYTGKWYCNKCISQERMPIPWKATEQFDLRGYTVCRTAYAELKSYFEKPIVQINKDNPIIRSNQTLYNFLVVKRQIHLIYDSICNLDLIEPLLKNKLNYCLKINLFSMKNLYDIYNGLQTASLQRQYQILSRHFYRCEICQKRHGYICPKCKYPVKIFPFQLKDTHGCKICRKLYHRKCLPTGQCTCKDQ